MSPALLDLLLWESMFPVKTSFSYTVFLIVKSGLILLLFGLSLFGDPFLYMALLS